MKLLLGLLIIFGMSSQSFATEFDLKTTGVIKTEAGQMLPNEKGDLEPVVSLSARLYMDWDCGFFTCKNGQFKMRTSSNIYAIPMTDDAAETLSLLGKTEFDKKGGVAVSSKDGKFQVSASATGADLRQYYHTNVIPGICRTENYCVQWAQNQQGQTYCIRWEQRTYCERDRYECYQFTERETYPSLNVKDAATQKVIAEVVGSRRLETTKRYMGDYNCGF